MGVSKGLRFFSESLIVVKDLFLRWLEAELTFFFLPAQAKAVIDKIA